MSKSAKILTKDRANRSKKMINNNINKGSNKKLPWIKNEGTSIPVSH